MSAAPLPENESERLAALMALEILGTERTQEFDIFPALASKMFSVPIAAISLVDRDRQWFKASVGLDPAETPRDLSFCAHALLEPGRVLYVPDATKDPRFSDNDLVVGEFGLRFYAGSAVIGPSGHALGALCIIDREPREVGQDQLNQLQQLAVGVGSALRLHASMQEMRNLALTDPLTGLRNRAGFEQRLRAGFERHRAAPAAGLGLLLLDVDCFKDVNDLFGHAGGDAALREVAQRLRRAARASDTMARLQGDKFCILAEDVRRQDNLCLLANRIHAALAEPFTIEQQSVSLQASIGVAASQAGACDPACLLQDADAALHRAKQTGRGLTCCSAPGPADTPLGAGRERTEELLRRALLPPGREPFVLALQPIFQGEAGRLDGFEALVRWPGAEGRLIPPSEFIPVAEATGLVTYLDRWVLDQACRLAAGWPGRVRVSSNLSAANFFAGDLLGDVRATLRRHALAPDRLKLEITESVLLRDPGRVQATIGALRDLGVHVVLDDFGTGHSSLGYLRDYAFDGLKIDRSFVSEIETNPKSQAFVLAIIGMARALGIEITAEGIERESQLQYLRGQAIGLAQGYLLGRPMTPKEASLLACEQMGRDHRMLLSADGELADRAAVASMAQDARVRVH